jgi:uncharacterized membrane protein YdfJ with MMPL/SSD domain
MDYHVFILSRVREGIDSGMSNDDALRSGITRTAGVVTSAATARHSDRHASAGHNRLKGAD